MQLKLRELGGDKAAKSELGALEKVRDKLNADLAKRAKEKKQLEDKIREQSRQLDDLAAAIARARALLDATAN
jgi:chromosome segregation ATPase